ncbi:MAG: choice-of-anchor J domain-containing protein [Cyclobacteriaceae bacterium]|nr:choice-of-anchor J domain-containing protein [Cyclobacteriaceae bacterium]
MEAEKLRREKYKFLPSETEFENWIAQKINERRNKLVPFGTKEVGEPDKIAVVIHVIHNGEPYGEGVNITDEQIYSQIEVLNEDYQRKNADTIKTQPEFLNAASKLNIEFVLARQTKDGNPTTGIVRVPGTKTSYGITVSERELLSGFSHWDPNIYLNIWVTNLTSPYIGLAQFPDLDFPGLEDEPNKDNEATDGMVVDYQAFGSSQKVPGLDLQTFYNLGRTSTHEIGHFFGLKHVWGDVTGSAGCAVDDYVSDTPNSSMEYSGVCTPSDHVSCGTNDMFENFLYYTNDECMNIFTADQVVRMQTILESAPRRGSLLNSIGTVYPGEMYFDLAINSIKSPGKVVCNDELNPVVEVKNNGTIPVTDFDIVYNFNNTEQTYTYQGDTIFSGAIIEIQLDQSTIQNGNYKLSVTLSNIPDDTNGSNNQMDHVFAVDDQTDFIPLREQFEAINLNATEWIAINEDNKTGWELTEAPLTSDENISAFINLYNYEDKQQLDWLISPSLDFSEAMEASVFFRASYAKNQNFNDQLRVLGSKDCGVNFDDVLEVFSSSDLSVTASEDFWEPTNQKDWLTHSIDLNEYAGKQNIRLAFLSVNDFGNNLYLDDIEIFATDEDKVVKTAQNSFTLYPNPTDDGLFKLSFNTSERQNVVIYIYDQMGRILMMDEYPNTLNQTYYYDLTGYRSGVYFINAKGKDFVRSKKLVISR